MKIKKCKICNGEREYNICGGCQNYKSLEEYGVNYLALIIWVVLGISFYLAFSMTFSINDLLSTFFSWVYLVFAIGLMIGALIQIIYNFKK